MRFTIILITVIILHLCWLHQAGANPRGNGGSHTRSRQGRGRNHRRDSDVTTTATSPAVDDSDDDDGEDTNASETSTRHPTRHQNRRRDNRRRNNANNNQDDDADDDGSDGHHQIGHTEVEYDVDFESEMANQDQVVRQQYNEGDFTNDEYNRNCSTCVHRETQKAMRLEMIKEQILRKLALDRPPNITDPGQIPDVPVLRRLRDRYNTEMQSDQPHFPPNRYDTNVQQTIEFATPPPEDLGVPEQWNIIYFGLEDIETTSLVEEAVLYFFVEPSMPMSQFTVSIELKKLLPPDRSGQDPRVNRTRYLKTTLTNEGMGAWYHMDVRNLVQTWVRNPTSNYGLMVEAHDIPHGDRLIVRMPSGQDRSYKPFIDLKYKKRNSNRSRRDLKGYNCRPLSKMTFCCRYRLEVNFASFGWTFIIQPQRYNMNYCSGDCPAYFLPKHPQTNMLTVTGSVQDGTPCCHPTSLTGIDMLYYAGDGNKIIVGQIDGMVIEECGCA